jgi:hypothetical protein
MNVVDFNTLELTKKADLVWEWGHYLTSTKVENFTIALFLTGNFFTEVYITPADNKTRDIKGVSKEDLDPGFKAILNYNDPFLKAFIGQKNNSETEPA